MAVRRFIPLTVSAVNAQTDSAVSVDFATAGKNEFNRFQPGQYINIKTTIDGQEVRRSYSLCEAAGGAFRVLVKRVANGVFSTYAATRLRAGDTLQVMPPMGNFAHGIAYNADTRVCGVAAGSGITPVISVLETVLAAGGEATLIYSNRQRDSIIFRARLAALKDRYLSRFALYHILSREQTDTPLFHGRLDHSRLQRLFSLCAPHLPHVLLCGPMPMMEAAQQVLLARSPATKVHRELFNAPAVPAAAPQTAAVTAAAATAFVHIDGIRRHIPVHSGETILQAAQRAGLETPYACTGGVCGTCRAQLISGNVQMAVNYAIEDEPRQDIILSCQARPVSAEIEVTFDI